MLAAILTAATIAGRYVARQGENPDNLWDMLFWILIPGFIGARLYYVFIQSPRGPEGIGYYLSNPGKILQILGRGYSHLRRLHFWSHCPADLQQNP